MQVLQRDVVTVAEIEGLVNELIVVVEISLPPQLLIQAGDDSAHTAPLSAAAVYQHAIRLLPEGDPLAGKVLGKAARAYFLAGRFDDAATAGRAALFTLPPGRMSARTAALTVNALTSSHRFDEALELAERILAASNEPMARLRTERATLLQYLDPGSDEAQALARRQFEWLHGIPGTPNNGEGPTRDYFLGLAEMYVADERFAKHYGGTEGATFVRDALRVFADRNL